MHNYIKKKITNNIICYKYNDKFNISNINLFKKCYNDWFKIDIKYIIELKEVISNLSDHNFNIKGYKLDNMIILFNNIKTKYYILLFNDNINLYIFDIIN